MQLTTQAAQTMAQASLDVPVKKLHLLCYCDYFTGAITLKVDRI